MANRRVKSGSSVRFYILGLQNQCSHEVKRCLLIERENCENPRQHIKKQRCDFVSKGPYSQLWFSSSHVWMWALDHKESWVPKNWCFWTMGLEKTLESPLDSKEIKPVNPKGNQLWIIIGKTVDKAETPILWLPGVKSWLLEKTRVLGKIKEATEDEMVGWHHQLDGCEFEQTLGDGKGQRSLVCCRPRGHKEWTTTK